MSDEFLLGVVQLIIYEMQGLVEFHRIGEIAWVGHPKCIASNLTSMLDNCTSHCHFYLAKMWEVDVKMREEREMGKVVEKEKIG